MSGGNQGKQVLALDADDISESDLETMIAYLTNVTEDEVGDS
jgi:hypothetical protein